MEEPRILIIGRKQVVIDSLIATLTMQGRNVTGTASREEVRDILDEEDIDLIVLGGGLDDSVRNELSAYIASIKPNIPIRLKDRVQGPEGMVDLINHIATGFGNAPATQSH